MVLAAPAARAADAISPITITAEPLLGGKVRAGEWAAVRVHVENAGPAVEGELRLDTIGSSDPGFAIPVQLATGAKQEHILLGRSGFFGSRFTVDLVQGDQVLATVKAPVVSIDPDALGVFVVAERPEGLLADVRTAAGSRKGRAASVDRHRPGGPPVTRGGVGRAGPADLAGRLRRAPDHRAAGRAAHLGRDGRRPRDPGRLGRHRAAGRVPGRAPPLPPRAAGRRAARRTCPSCWARCRPARRRLPALAGILRDGSVLGSTAGPDGSGELVVGARTSVGRGSTTILGIDPATPWLAGSAVARDVWTGILRPDVLASGIVASQDDGMLVNALDYLPSVGLPPMDQLFLLFLAYVLLLGRSATWCSGAWTAANGHGS